MNKESCLRSLDVICGYLPFVFGCQGTVDMSPPHLTNKKQSLLQLRLTKIIILFNVILFNLTGDSHEKYSGFISLITFYFKTTVNTTFNLYIMI